MDLLPAFVSTPELNRVYNCSAEVMLTALTDDSIDLIVTSPPYDNLRTYNGFSWNFEYIARQSYRVLKPGGVLVWVVGDATVDGSESLSSFEQALYFKQAVGLKVWQTLIWEKNAMPGDFGKRYRPCSEFMFVMSKGIPATWNPVMQKNATAGQKKNKGHSGKNGWVSGRSVITPETSVMTNVWYIPVGAPTASDFSLGQHPAMFPETLAERHILTWSNPGDIVLDYFAGSGTTLKMARKNGRNYLGCDISREYCDLMERRLSMPYTPSFIPLLEFAT